MPIVFGVDTEEVRKDSQRIITSLGGQLCDWLPWLDRTMPRRSNGVASRALVMNAIIQLHFGAPIPVICRWVESNGLSSSLSAREREILSRSTEGISQQESADLFWSIEALWALVWAGTLIPDIPIDAPVGNTLASLLPDLRVNEPAAGFLSRFRLRPPGEIYRKLDLYYLAHWYARDGQLRGVDTAPFSLDIIMERRKALEWIMDESIEDWDETPQDT